MIEDSEVSHTPSGKKVIDIVDNAKMVFNVNAYDDDLHQQQPLNLDIESMNLGHKDIKNQFRRKMHTNLKHKILQAIVLHGCSKSLKKQIKAQVKLQYKSSFKGLKSFFILLFTVYQFGNRGVPQYNQLLVKAKKQIQLYFLNHNLQLWQENLIRQEIQRIIVATRSAFQGNAKKAIKRAYLNEYEPSKNPGKVAREMEKCINIIKDLIE